MPRLTGPEPITTSPRSATQHLIERGIFALPTYILQSRRPHASTFNQAIFHHQECKDKVTCGAARSIAPAHGPARIAYHT